mmetsp:Transcript_25960/g.44667  ORF Transcript_25960/g.44667 Transcript_25960/m.44667 type:complete len:98 (-) Transcript_25960:448-741(-)
MRSAYAAYLVLFFATVCFGVPAIELSDPDHAQGTKEEWPELVGKPASEAEAVIKETSPHLAVQVVPRDAFVTADYDEQRVRLFVDKSNNVVSVPRLG